MRQTENKRIIVYHTQVYFLDTAIEYVRLLSNENFEVHVLIELSPNQLRANILDIKANLESYHILTPYRDIKNQWELEHLAPYFENCASAHFVLYPSKKIRHTWKIVKKMWEYIDSLRPDYIHLDDFSNRSFFSLPFFLRNRKKIIANIHDPITHTGEFQWQREIFRKIWFNSINRYVVFSEYSKTILAPQLSKEKSIEVLKLMPYTVYNYFLPKVPQVRKIYVTFIGRISPYKGVELFVKASALITDLLPEVKFYVGGKVVDGYNPEFLSVSHENLLIEDKFLSNTEVAEVINKSKLVVCPYIDATQSGVIMTAHALGCPVMVTNTGGLPEYIENEINGVIIDGTSVEKIAAAVVEFIKNEDFDKMHKNLKSREFFNFYKKFNAERLPQLYK